MRNSPLGRPIRVLSLYPTFWPRQGGGQMVLAAIAQGLSPQMSNVVLTRGFRDLPARQDYEYLSVRRYLNPAPEMWKDYAAGTHHVSFLQKSWVTALDIICSLNALTKLSTDADLIHLHFPLPLGISALMVRPLVRRPLVVTVHGNADVYELPRPMEPITRAVLLRADVVVSVSHHLGDYLQRVMRVPRITVVPNGIDVGQFQVGSGGRSGLTLLSISRLVPRKNVDVLIAAVQQLANAGADISLVVAGTGPERERIERLAAASSGVVRFVGFIDEPKKRELLSQADIFVQLSIREGLSIAVLEALASGLPCVVSDLPGVREPIASGETGWYVGDPEDVQSVVETLTRVLQDRTRLPDMRQSCRSVAVERYSLERMCDSYWTIFADLLKGRS